MSLSGEKAQVEEDVLADDSGVADERLQVGGDLGEEGRVLDVFGTNAGEALDEVRERNAQA